MPVTLNIIESTTELGLEVVEVVLASASEPGPAGPGVPAGGTDGQVLTKASATDYDTAWEDATGGGGASALVDLTDVTGQPPAAGEAPVWDGDSFELTNVATQAELDTGLAGKSDTGHAHAGEDITSGTVADARIASTIARDSEVTTAVANHEADTSSVHGIADTSALALTANHPTNATFNDHSARHEDGGPDEISLTGLSGISAALQSHLDDAADAHDAGAISFSPTGTIAATDVQTAIAEVASEAGAAVFCGVQVVETSAQVIPTGTVTAITFNDADVFDTDGYHDTASNTSRLTVPTGLGGYYDIKGFVRWDNVTGGTYRRIYLRLNGSTVIAEALVWAGATSPWVGYWVHAVRLLAQTDYVEMTADHDRGSDLSVKGDNAPTRLMMYRVGPA